MHSFSVSRDIPHTPQRVWALMDNFADIWIYNPNVRHSESLNGQQSGLGAERLCVLYDDNEVQERVTEHNADAMRQRVEVYGFGNMPMTKMDIEIRVEPTPSGSRVTIEGAFQPKFGVAGWVLAKTVMVGQFQKAIDKLILGADQHLASGRIIEKGGALGAPLAA